MDKNLHFTRNNQEIDLLVQDIVFFQSDRNYFDITTRYGLVFDCIRGTLTDLEDRLNELGTYDEHRMFRIKGNCIVNTSYLIEINPYGTKDTSFRPFVTLKYGDNVVNIEASKPKIKKLLTIRKQEEQGIVLKTVSHNLKLTVPVNDLCKEHSLHHGHEYIDLGLPSNTLWAIMNVDSVKPEQEGSLIRRDDRNTAESLMICEYSSHPGPRLQAEIDNYSISSDVAKNNWHGEWRLPTVVEAEELVSECKWQWIRTKNNQHGALITGPNGNSIFLPAIYAERDFGKYWLAETEDNYGKYISFHEDEDTGGARCSIQEYRQDRECLIRPVLTKSSIK